MLFAQENRIDVDMSLSYLLWQWKRLFCKDFSVTNESGQPRASMNCVFTCGDNAFIILEYNICCYFTYEHFVCVVIQYNNVTVSYDKSNDEKKIYYS